VQGLYLNTVLASQAETIQDEILGSSRGVANQTFTLATFPVITEQLWVNELAALSEGERAALKARDDVEIDDLKDDQGTTTAFWVRWQPVDDLTEAHAADRVYSIDRTFGQVQFGDGIHGMVPPAGRDNLQGTYQAGGGVRGNVAASLITALRTTIPFVDRVVNRLAAGGGSDTETLDHALERGPQMLKHRSRAVTTEDFEWLTREASQAIARVKVLPNFNDQGRFETGWVTVIIVPESQDARPLPSPQLRAQVEQFLRDRAANLVTFPRQVQVTGPTYVAVNVEAVLVPTRIELAPQVEATALQRLRRFLHPLTGGYLNRGWEFGRLPCLSDFYTLLEDVDGVDHVDHLAMTLRAVTPTGATVGEPQRVTEEEPLAVTMPEHTLIYGETLTITVKA
jgi:predicted phage baseplate assembly protein